MEKNFVVITQKQIDETVSWDGLKEFGSFVLSYSTDGNLPDYKKMDLMRVAKLVPDIWVFDLREYENNDQILVNFCGENALRSWGFNLIGKDYIKLLEQRNDADVVKKKISEVRQAISQKTVSYRKINEFVIYNDYRKAGFLESLMFPCSSDGITVNWAIGCIHYQLGNFEGENLFLHF
jgi:hypothetical protein